MRAPDWMNPPLRLDAGEDKGRDRTTKRLEPEHSDLTGELSDKDESVDDRRRSVVS